ncbi:MAG TPA: hypothetical protein VGM91_08340 [Conexibacter sp.]|jgi:hypothetical protein
MALPAKRRIAMVLVSGAVVAGVAGCGGGSSSNSRLSHSELVSKANAACQKANTTVAALQSPTDNAGLASYSSKLAAATGQMEQQIASLKPPSSDERSIGAYLAALRQSNALLAQLRSAAQQGNTGQVREIGTQLQAIGIGALAARAGLGSCATPPATKAS